MSTPPKNPLQPILDLPAGTTIHVKPGESFTVHEPGKKPVEHQMFCAQCNPRPAPALTLDECPECEARTKQDLLRRFHAQQERQASQARLGKAALARLVAIFLDNSIREDLALLIVAWGYAGCFYDDLETAVMAAGHWQWFLEECDQVEHMRKFVRAFDERQRIVAQCALPASVPLGRRE